MKNREIEEYPVPLIDTEKELKKHLKTAYVIEDYMSCDKDYDQFQEQLYAVVKGCYVHLNLRDYPVKFKFYNRDKEYHTLPLRHFLINVFFWYPLVELHGVSGVMTKDLIIDCKNDIPHIDHSLNKMIITLREYSVKNTKINYDISHAMYNLRRISGDFSLILGLNFDAFTLIDEYIEDESFRDIMNHKVDPNMQPSEVEAILKDLQKKLIANLMSKPENPIGVILRSGTGIKHKQLSEFLISQGFKPDLSGNTIPLPIQNSTVLGGLKSASDLYIDANGARKSMIMSHKVMGRAGHFGKVLTELSRTLSLSRTVSDCGTRHLVPYFITNKTFLRKIDGKYYSEEQGNLENLKIINANKDEHLIGKTIYVRSAATCALENEVCAKCFGMTASLNFDIADGIGAFLAEEVAKRLEQDILSTKHLLQTDSQAIKFNAEFDQFFSINADEISPKLAELDDDIADLVITFDKESIKKDDEMDAEEGFNTYIETGKFFVKNTRTKEVFTMQEANGTEIFFTDDCLRIMKKSKNNTLRFKDMDDDTVLFVVTISNNELTKPLYEMMNLVNNDKSSDIDRTIEEVSQRFINLIIQSNMTASAISAEFVINRLIRKEDDIFERPDFSSVFEPKYKIVTVAKALEKNKAPLVGLSYQFVKRQLLNDDTFTVKDATSYLDPFFQEKISTKKRKKHIAYVKKQKEEEMKKLHN